MKQLLTVNKKTCTSCGACIEVCPRGIIDFSDKTYPKSTDYTEANCTKCGHCVSVCPTGSISHREMSPAACGQIRKDLFITPEQAEQLIRYRRSMRIFSKKRVPRELLQRIIEIARYAPTGHNRQTIKWFVIDDKKTMDKIREYGMDYMRGVVEQGKKLKPVPENVGWFENILMRWEKRGEDELLRGAPALIMVYSEETDHFAQNSATIAISYLDLVANSFGLGCCWNGQVNSPAMNYPPMKKLIGLPEGCKPYGTIAIGYSKYKYHRLPTRKEPSIMWHPGLKS